MRISVTLLLSSWMYVLNVIPNALFSFDLLKGLKYFEVVTEVNTTMFISIRR